tara:strand:- start:1201 stop:1917 length:717 start_codon:yes stop_codon:yes gene_type:complete
MKNYFEKISIYLDGANIEEISSFAKNNIVKGFTTNPTLMKNAGIKDYLEFTKEACKKSNNKPISFEVFTDDFESMEKEAEKISSIAENVYVKIPITNTKGEFSGDLIKVLSDKGIKLNITAIFTTEQCNNLSKFLNPATETIISLFCGRIADTGRNPEDICRESKKIFSTSDKFRILWASTREIYNIAQAIDYNCDIITVPGNILSKLTNFDKDLELFSLETVKMFYEDAKKAGYKIL